MVATYPMNARKSRIWLKETVNTKLRIRPSDVLIWKTEYDLVNMNED